MLLEFLLNRRYISGLITGCIAGIFAAWLAIPLYKSVLIHVYGDRFATLTFKCDQAMREHWIGKMALADDPSDETIANLNASEIALLDCQEYDLLQKKLLRLGLSDAEVGELVLRASERDPEGFRTVIGIHEIRH